MSISSSANSARLHFTATSGQTAFSVSFEFFDNADLDVYVNGTQKTITTHYTVSGGDGSTGTVTFNSGLTLNDAVTITRRIDIERVTDFSAGQAINRAALNTQLDTLTAISSDNKDRAERSLRAPDDENAPTMTLPSLTSRKGTVLGFNATSGNVEAGPKIADVSTLAAVTADIATLADIEDGTDATDAIQTVAGIASNVSTVAGVSSAVSTVAGISSNVTAVAADATDIGVVAGKAAEIGRLGTAQAVADLDILATTDAVSDMNTLAAISSNISTVASISANVTSVAGVASLITSDFVADLNTLATTDIVSDLNTLATADIVSDLNTLATSDIVSDLNTLATSDIVSDMNLLATSDVIADMAALAGSGGAPNISALTITKNSGTGILPALTILCSDTTAIQNQDLGKIEFQTSDSNEAGTVSRILATRTNSTSASTNEGALEFYTGRPNDLSLSMTINADHTVSFSTGIDVTGAITVSGTVDGRDVSADGTKLDGIEASADVTDTANVTAAGALMDSELTNIAAVKALNQGLATTDEPSFDNTTLNAIAATISDTAVDIFVYDTRKDSDGGAWRKRTQHTSWYNETLNTATRGSRKEFPSVAVIVAESTQLTIYDGDDPDLPMWMIFNLIDNHSHFNGFDDNRFIGSVAALNGLICTGITHVSGYFNEISFIEDTGYSRTPGYYQRLNATISQRSETGITKTQINSTDGVVNRYVNDVAMTVLPNAPIDAATGLPVPTIAVATDGGVSVIKDDGTVVSGHTGVAAEHIMLHESGALVYGVTGAGNDNFSLHLDLGNTTRDTFYDARTNEGVYDTYLNEGSGECLFEGNKFDLALAQSKGLLRVAEQPDFSTGLHNRTTSSYNTGWQNGDIKLATLSDTDDTNVTGSELVTNGSMEANNSWEAVGTPTASGQTSAQAHSGTYSWYFTGDGNYDGIQSSVDFSITSGKAYVIDAWVYPVNDTGITLKFGGVNRTVTGLTQGAWNQVTETIVSTQTTVAGTIGFNTDITWGSGTWYIDDVSVRLAEEDRSVNNNGLQVFGTVTKSAVNTGADLVGYSGADGANTNFLFQPYNSDLDFGTGDFSYIFWHSCASSSSDRIWLSHGQYTTAGAGLGILQYNSSGSSGDEIYIYVGNSGAGNINVTGVEGLGFQQWVITRRSGIVYAYRNGKLEGSVANTNNINLSSATIKGLYVGKGNNTTTEGNAFVYGAHRLALFRISATAPSPEQIKKIYEDEKFLFQENAKAVLYGSSDAVTALAYDDSTDLLHVGTSAGRSVFQGLRRVDNTTTAVGASISASNGLVADE